MEEVMFNTLIGILNGTEVIQVNHYSCNFIITCRNNNNNIIISYPQV